MLGKAKELNSPLTAIETKEKPSSPEAKVYN
jgi:hypothetical protein